MHHCVTVGYRSRRRTRKEPFGRKVSADAQRVELSGPPAVIAKYWCSRNRPCEADLHRRETSLVRPSNRGNSAPKRISFQYWNLNCLIWPNYRDYSKWAGCLFQLPFGMRAVHDIGRRDPPPTRSGGLLTPVARQEELVTWLDQEGNYASQAARIA